MDPVFFQVVVAAIGVFAQLAISYLGRRQSAKQSVDTNELQRLVSNRAAASFIAGKRQDWIDGMRHDLGEYLARSQEISYKWDAFRGRVAEVRSKTNPKDFEEVLYAMREEFSVANGALDRQNEEIYIRLKLRLNSNELGHKDLLGCLAAVKENLSQMALVPHRNEELMVEMRNLVAASEISAQRVLKYEWERVKRDVAYPENMMNAIPKLPPPSGDEGRPSN